MRGRARRPRRDDTFAALDGTLGAHRPGANGVLFLPWLARRERAPERM